MLKELNLIFQLSDKKLCELTPFPAIDNRSEYETLDCAIRTAAITKAESFLDYEFKGIPATLYMEMCRNGNRTNYEDANFSKRYALSALIIGECIENKRRFIDNIVNGLWSIMEESSWCLPAHNGYEQGLSPIADTGRPILDLFACETGAFLATSSYLLKPVLDNISPFICERINREIMTRIVNPYLDKHWGWMGNGYDGASNWTVWCTQNVLISTFLSDTDTTTKNAVIQKSCESIDCFINTYSEDGGCDEGAEYYHHAALCMYLGISIINRVTAGAFSEIFNLNKIKNIALYIKNVHISGPYYVNFADCSPVAGTAGAREYLFGKAIGSKELMDYAASDYNASDDKLLPLEINLYYHALSLFSHNEITSHELSTKNDFIPPMYYDRIGLFMARNNDLFLAVKAGCNGDSHNHNDTGSFIVYSKGKPAIIDVGVLTYTIDTFSNNRYSIWTMQSGYHNLPMIGEYMEKDGAEFAASEVNVILDSDSPSITMNIENAFENSTDIGKYKRTFTFDLNSSTIFVSETATACATVTLVFMLYNRPDYSERCIKNSDILISFDVNVNVTIEEIEISDLRLKRAWKHNIYRVLVTNNNSNTGTISYRITN